MVFLFPIAILISFVPYYTKAAQIIKWRRTVKDFIRHNENYKYHKLILNESSFTVVQDDKEEIQKWFAITHVEIGKNYLLVNGPTQFLFPRNAMPEDDYQFFIDQIRLHLKADKTSTVNY